MESLVFCGCGHPLSAHEWNGCGGDPHRGPCPCSNDRAGALDSAISSARTESMYANAARAQADLKSA